MLTDSPKIPSVCTENRPEVSSNVASKKASTALLVVFSTDNIPNSSRST